MKIERYMASSETIVVTTSKILSIDTPQKKRAKAKIKNIVCIIIEFVDPIERVARIATRSRVALDFLFRRSIYKVYYTSFFWYTLAGKHINYQI
jgi:hypothetical protein